MPTERIVAFQAQRLVIVDSVPSGKWASGKMLYNRVSEWQDTTVKLKLEYTSIDTATELNHFLKNLTESVEHEGIPILHISMHGDKDGLQLASGECVSWDELTPYFINLNFATKNNLLVTIAACYGLYSAYVNATKYDRSAFWCIMGRQDEHSGGDFTNDYSKFYRSLLETSNFGDAIKVINGTEKHYRIYSGIALFVNTAQASINHFFVDGEEHKLRKELKKKLRKSGNPIPNKQLTRAVREKLISSIFDWRIKFFLIVS